jgi:prophage regulatory protein
MRRPAVEAVTGLSRSAIYDMVAKGRFPRPIPLGRRAVGWLAGEVDDWLKARVAERDQLQARREDRHA